MAQPLTLRQDESGMWRCAEEPEATVLLCKQSKLGATVLRRVNGNSEYSTWQPVKIVALSGPKPKIV